MNITLYFQLADGIINVITFIISLALLISFLRLKKRAFGLYMILILNISAVIFSFISLLSFALEDNQTTAVIFGALQITLYNFALYWSTSLAMLVYSIVRFKKTIDAKKFMCYAIGGCAAFAIAIIVATILNLWDADLAYFAPGLFSLEQPHNDMLCEVMYVVTYDLIGTLVPIIITFYCYLHVFRSIRDKYGASNKNAHASTSRMLWYSGIQMICFVPAVLLDIVSIFAGWANLEVVMITFVLHRSWGFLNALAYWFLRTNHSERQTSLISEAPTSHDSQVAGFDL